MIGVGLFKSIRTPGNILDGRGGTGQPSAGELSLQYPKIDKVKRYHAAARGRLPADKLWGFVAQLTRTVDAKAWIEAAWTMPATWLTRARLAREGQVRDESDGFHASPLADCTVKTRYGSEMTPKKEAQMLAVCGHERSQGFATQCKRALDKLGVLGVLTMMSPASEKSQAACNSAVEKAIRNAVGSSTHETGAPGLSDGLTVMGCGPASPKGTQAGLGGSPTSRTQGSRKGRETDSEEMSAMGLTVQRMETAKTAEHAPEMEPEEPEEPQEGEARGRLGV
ncbi:unnamed protein product [Symbiodinium necroappetens]|uniref:Uncharacterized protein n=1 Tax=Symbiodinium necroappetens TaxID=1628268 RepID=A0A812YMI1_9DINO|nr:unnamed protein product [Symbiodinium necroappetens]